MSVYSFRLILSLIIILIAESFAQNAGDTLWTKYYGGDAYDEAGAVVNAHDSGYVFAGFTQSYGLGRWGNALIGKTTPQGDSIGTFNFGGPGMDVLTDVIQTADGNYLAVGLSDSETQFEQVYIVKFNDSGDTLWTRTYGDSLKEIAYSVLQTDDEGFIISALTSSKGAGEEDIWILRTDGKGDTLWTRTYGTPGNDAGYAICRTSDSAYAVTGIMDFSDLVVLKIDNSGEPLWMKTFGGAGFEEGTSILETSDNHLMVLGHTSSYGAGELDIYLLRLTADGDSVFTKTYGSAMYEEGRDIIELSNNEFIIAGNTSQNSPSGFMDYDIISVDSTGKVLWDNVVGSEFPDRCYDILNTHDGNFIVAGSNSRGGALEDAALTLFFGNIPVGINDESPEVNSYKLFDAYPNPFNPSTNIRYTIPHGSMVSIKVYNILGSEVAEVVNSFINPGTYTLTFNAQEHKLSSGVYFITIKAGDFTSTRKIVLMK